MQHDSEERHRLLDGDKIRYPFTFAFLLLLPLLIYLPCSKETIRGPANQGFLTPFISMAEEVDKSRNCDAEDREKTAF
jgi:hypothetical protein